MKSIMFGWKIALWSLWSLCLSHNKILNTCLPWLSSFKKCCNDMLNNCYNWILWFIIIIKLFKQQFIVDVLISFTNNIISLTVKFININHNFDASNNVYIDICLLRCLFLLLLKFKVLFNQTVSTVVLFKEFYFCLKFQLLSSKH